MQEYMGKTYDKALTDDEKAFLRSWGQYNLIRANEDEFSGGAQEEIPNDPDPHTRSVLDPNATQRVVETPSAEDDDEDADDEDADDYDDWTKAELEAEVAKRNDDPENTDNPVEVVGTGKNGSVIKEDLIKGLRMWDQADS